MKDGKATLTFCSAGDQTGHKRRFLINNAPPGDLEKTLRFMGSVFFFAFIRNVVGFNLSELTFIFSIIPGL